jgi:hypothetical protein
VGPIRFVSAPHASAAEKGLLVLPELGVAGQVGLFFPEWLVDGSMHMNDWPGVLSRLARRGLLEHDEARGHQ